MKSESKIGPAFWALRLGLGGTAFLAGADKFTNLLARWDKYLAPEAKKRLPTSKRKFMRAIGVVEMLVGIGILSPRTRVASYAAAAWLTGIAANLWLNGDYDIAVRDLNMAIAAFALGRLSSVRGHRVAGDWEQCPSQAA
ncbi:MAG TPA: hypothetical protein VF133_03090 [Terriglobales bacterium]